MPVEPPPDVVAWALAQLGRGARLVRRADPPQQRENGPWLLDVSVPGGTETRVVLHLGEPAARRQFRTEVAALTHAERNGLAAPRVLAADLDGPRLVLLQSALEGTSRIPRDPPLDRARAFGRAIAAIHAVGLEPSEDLPSRARSLEGFDFDALAIPAEAVELFDRVRAASAAGEPLERRGLSTLVHGDLWQGNTLWTGDTTHAGTIDWDFAGAGHPAIDLGTARFDAAIFHGPDHADALVDGWRTAIGEHLDPSTLALGDLLAVRCSPPDLRDWLPNFHAQGRRDLDLGTVTDRRNRFAEQALRNVDK